MLVGPDRPCEDPSRNLIQGFTRWHMQDQSRRCATGYQMEQDVMALLKSAVHHALALVEDAGITNAELGRMLGIYHGHIGHEGHIPRTLLAIMEAEGVVVQDKASKRWRLR